ncbi:MAG: DNA alkylation repair protein [Candidatus Paceibacterota bacterium]|jgi:3-methyladenine DNA glycosylase AlkD
MSIVDLVKKDLRKFEDKKRAKNLSWFFKTEKGGYGEGDKFIGLKVPEARSVAKKYFDAMTLKDVADLLKSVYHEDRQVALFILVYKFQKETQGDQEKIFNLYVKNTGRINNWDLVDCSAPYIVGPWLYSRDRSLLYKYAKSKNLWERRIAIISTAYFIRQKDFRDTIKICEILIKYSHDLIHKATGWMLREVGNRDQKVLRGFLDQHLAAMPRTMLRYAIEKLPETIRLCYLKKPIKK